MLCLYLLRPPRKALSPSSSSSSVPRPFHPSRQYSFLSRIILALFILPSRSPVIHAGCRRRRRRRCVSSTLAYFAQPVPRTLLGTPVASLDPLRPYRKRGTSSPTFTARRGVNSLTLSRLKYYILREEIGSRDFSRGASHVLVVVVVADRRMHISARTHFRVLRNYLTSAKLICVRARPVVTTR